MDFGAKYSARSLWAKRPGLDDRTSPASRTIVISGDTSAVKETIKACNSCDLLIHEAQSLALYEKMPERLHSLCDQVPHHHATVGRTGNEGKAKIASDRITLGSRSGIAAPKFAAAINSGNVRSTTEMLQEELGSRYSGQFVTGRGCRYCSQYQNRDRCETRSEQESSLVSERAGQQL